MDKKQYKEALNLFKGYIYDNEVTELELNFPIYRDIYEYLMLPSKDNLCFSSAFIVLLCQLSRPLNFYKFHIDLRQEANQPKIPMNVYGINILKSGGGKGLTNNIVKGLLNFDYAKKEYVKQIGEDIVDENGEEEDKKKEINKNINKLYNIVDAEEQASASTAGMRVAYDELKNVFNTIGMRDEYRWVGSAFYNLQELADSLENASSYDKDFFSTLKEMYDLGEFSAKALKTGVMGSIKQFYISFLGATTDKTLQNNPKTSRLLNNFFISGHARRSLISMPNPQELAIVEGRKKNTDGMSLRELFEAKKFVESDNVKNVKEKVRNNICRFANLARKQQKNISLTDECYFYYNVYKWICAEKAKNVNSSILELETENRFWKALKISGILAMYDGAFSISEDYFLEAVKIVEYYAHHFKRCLNNRVTDVNDKIIELLMDSKTADGEICGITSEELRTNNEVNSFKENANVSSGDFIKKALREVEEMLDMAGYQLMAEKRGYKGKMLVYAAIPNDWINPKMSNDKPYRVWDDVPKGE